jgi:nucleotide-binding universal stress UspA family protein
MTVLACVDGSRYTASVCAYAARAARRLDTGIALLHAIARPADREALLDRSGVMTVDMTEEALEEFTRVHEASSRLAQTMGRRVLEDAEERVRAAGVISVRERLVFGELVDSLAEYDAGVRLIVMGKRGASEGDAASHLGSNLERMVRASHHPILIVPAEPRPLQRFVVAFDAGPSANTIIETLTKEPLLLDAECILLTVGAGDVRQRELMAAATRLRAAGYRVTERLEPGHVDQVILATVRETNADLLVMGAYGHSRLRMLMVGSTTTALLRTSTVPVLVIREQCLWKRQTGGTS